MVQVISKLIFKYIFLHCDNNAVVNMSGGKIIDSDEKRSDRYWYASSYINDTLTSASGYRAISRRN